MLDFHLSTDPTEKARFLLNNGPCHKAVCLLPGQGTTVTQHQLFLHHFYVQPTLEILGPPKAFELSYRKISHSMKSPNLQPKRLSGRLTRKTGTMILGIQQKKIRTERAGLMFFTFI